MFGAWHTILRFCLATFLTSSTSEIKKISLPRHTTEGPLQLWSQLSTASCGIEAQSRCTDPKNESAQLFQHRKTNTGHPDNHSIASAGFAPQTWARLSPTMAALHRTNPACAREDFRKPRRAESSQKEHAADSSEELFTASKCKCTRRHGPCCNCVWGLTGRERRLAGRFPALKARDLCRKQPVTPLAKILTANSNRSTTPSSPRKPAVCFVPRAKKSLAERLGVFVMPTHLIILWRSGPKTSSAISAL